MERGEYRNYRDGDKCPNCKKGYIERVVVPGKPGSFLAGATSLVFTLGFAGDDSESSYSYYRCNNCGKEPTDLIYDKELYKYISEDIVYSKKDIFNIIKYICYFFLLILISILSVAGIGYFIGFILN